MNQASWTGTALVALLAVLLAVWVVWRAASRLDRLHRRVFRSRATLDAQLVRRATAAWDLATADVLGPERAAAVAEAAREALERTSATLVAIETTGVPRTSAEPEQAIAESELSRVLRATLGDATDRTALGSIDGAADLLEALDREWYRVQLARRFYNDAVVQVRRIRAKWYVRLLRLAGRAPNPQTFEMDDATAKG